jgi:hypothetical protein
MAEKSKVKQIHLTDEEIDVLIKLLNHAVPEMSDQEVVWNLANKLRVYRKL